MDITVETNGFIEAIKILTIITGSGLATYMIFTLFHWRSHKLDAAEILRVVAFLGFGMLTAFQQIIQLDKPILIWRLPLLLLCSAAALISCLLPDIRCYWQTQKKSEMKRLEWPDDAIKDH